MSPPQQKSLSDLLAVMAALRTPGSGCPWDLAQSFRTIAPYTIEEAYEVADAIESGDRAALKEELGDLLLQVVYHARLAEEEGAFAFADVVDAITTKMLRRHPHVFGSAAERAAGAKDGFWERIKAEEKQSRPPRGGQDPEAARDTGPAPRVDVDTSRAAGAPGPPLRAEVALGLPALPRARKLQDKAATVGFDWPSLIPVFEKLKEELGELECAASGQAGGKAPGAPADAAVAEE